MKIYPAWVPYAPGTVGTGPTDLWVATDVLKSPGSFDVPGGSAVIFERAYHWFVDAARTATSEAGRAENHLGTARTLNNYAVWCLKKCDDPQAGQIAIDALAEAERITDALDTTPVDLRFAILANIAGLLGATGHTDLSRKYLQMSQALGVKPGDTRDPLWS